MNEQVAYAQLLAALGIAVFPVDHPALPECVGLHSGGAPCNGNRGKHPAVKFGTAASTDRAEVLRLFRVGQRNFGGNCGRSRLLVVDEDRPGEFARAAAKFGQQTPDTFRVSTGREGGGTHHYFRQAEHLPFTNSPGPALKEFKLDVRGRGGFVLLPGSTHQTGRVYQADDWATPIRPVPLWLAEALTRRPERQLTPVSLIRDPDPLHIRRAISGLLRVVTDAPVGERNTRLNWAAYRLFQRVTDGQLPEADAVDLLHHAAAGVQLPHGEADATIKSAREAALR